MPFGDMLLPEGSATKWSRPVITCPFAVWLPVRPSRVAKTRYVNGVAAAVTRIRATSSAVSRTPVTAERWSATSTRTCTVVTSAGSTAAPPLAGIHSVQSWPSSRPRTSTSNPPLPRASATTRFTRRSSFRAGSTRYPDSVPVARSAPPM
ncbi:hypothetical protein GCM10023214_77040 [Amycolatopsis dongchuanensis]|uniref:Uncharacterized protein n=1 Tax=Amycolatopsis dongchuanensis TaxID=1070866 RepID=A0ABP8VUF5_9PSEU